jgi:PleD family two-component response regulator
MFYPTRRTATGNGTTGSYATTPDGATHLWRGGAVRRTSSPRRGANAQSLNLLPDGDSLANGAPAKRWRVMLVHADTHRRHNLAAALRDADYGVELAADGVEALSRIAADAVETDALVLDASDCPGDVLEIRRRLRGGGRGMVILLIAGRNKAEDCVAALEAGADDYLVTPFALDEMLARLCALLRRSRWQSSATCGAASPRGTS